MIELVSEYLKINTAHPKPNYDAAIDFFINIAHEDGFTIQKILLPSGFPLLIITYEGTDTTLPSLGLNHHMDTVAASNKSEWEFPPFSGTVSEGKIYGRGAQDMKGVGIVHYAALRELKKKNIKLARTVHMIIVPEEELGGFKGVGEFVQTAEFKKLNLGFMLDEGKPSGDNRFLFIKIAERKPIQIKVTSKGALTHSSKLMALNAAHELIRLLHNFVVVQDNQQKKADNSDPGMFLSINITSFGTSTLSQGQLSTFNVIPEYVTATIDIRVPPTISLRQTYAFLDDAIKNFPTISYEIIAQATQEPLLFDQASLLYSTLQSAIEQENIQAKPLVFEASTDIRFYLEKGIQGVGFTPFLCQDRLHETDEYVDIKDLIVGQKILYSFVKEFCSESSG